MSEIKINDRKMLQLIDKDRMSQSEAARELGVTRQAVNQRLKELRGRTTKAVVAKRVDECINQKFDSIEQLTTINEKAFQLLDDAEGNPDLCLKCLSEIRAQLKLQLDIFSTLYDLRSVAEFQEEVLTAIGEVSPDVRKEIIDKLNQRRSIRSAVRFS